jgi:aminoglycoside phosphotransferase (APT) family kinase protein
MGLLGAARDRLETIPVPHDEHVFIHGDSWLGNTAWTGANELSGMID